MNTIFLCLRWFDFWEIVTQRCSVKKVFLEISQNSQENACARVSFFNKISKNTFCYRTPSGDCFCFINQHHIEKGALKTLKFESEKRWKPAIETFIRRNWIYLIRHWTRITHKSIISILSFLFLIAYIKIKIILHFFSGTQTLLWNPEWLR